MMNVYLSGPLTDCTDEEAFGWRRLVARFFENTRLRVIIPGLDEHGKGYDEIVRQDKRDIDSSCVVIANPWKDTVGTSMEVMYAYLRYTPVVVIARPNGAVNPWLMEHAWRIAGDVQDACNIVSARWS
jgi:hypothetical protein